MKPQSKERHIVPRYIQSRHAIFLRVTLLCLPLLLHPVSANASSIFSSMFNMMGSMANMMSMMVSPMHATGTNFPMNGLSGFAIPMNNSTWPMTGFQGMPLTGTPRFPGTGAYGNRSYNSYQQQPSTGPGNFWLNGLWVADSKIYLHISNKIFQLQTPRGGITGYVTSNGDLLNLYDPRSNRTILYTVKLVSGYMQLTGEDGRTHLFKKMG